MDLKGFQWTREPQEWNISENTIEIVTKPHTDLWIDMKPKSEISQELYQMMLDRGYQERFCDLVTQNLNTDFTAQRMIYYLSHYSELPEGETVDEMLAILSDRNRIMQKKELEYNNAKYNEYLNRKRTEEE